MHIDVDVVVVFRDTEMNIFYLAQLDVVWLGLLISLCSNFWSASHLVLMLCVLFVFFVRFGLFTPFCGEFDPGSG